ncbi:MarR family winged helix-turn-helix transcriptional regulator [Lacisediminihabitans changchengi]|uniref:MarR family transcriptional regulator n=1 Tax=Lacisediminihabitans changchengi TaxID=2787634 RepID=A0A934SPR0_9MICO|nr:MarR family transcriptional regulator [Lacisediminihabitans changchengi]MBK4348972.1 MarR family transcriptional regulator [Lacisediminihabitans changchengi]
MVTPDEERNAVYATDLRPDELSFALRELSERFRAHDRELASRMNLKPSEYYAIEHILDARGSLGPAELASRLGLAAATTSELLDRLQQLGHVERHRDSGDGRRVRLTPTESAISAVIAVISPAVHAMDQVASQYTAEERAVILRFLQQTSAALTSEPE